MRVLPVTWRGPIAVLLTLALLYSRGSAATVRVPLDQPTIGEGIAAASMGDTVLVAPGIYTGPSNRDMAVYGLLVRSESGPEVTVIDCEELGRAFSFGSHWSAPAEIEGFTIRRGKPPFGDHYSGGGMYLGGEVVVRDCIFEDCISGGIKCANYATITGCEFYRCWGASAGAVSMGGWSTVEDCVFVGNWAYDKGGAISASGLIQDYNAAVIRSCTFVGNSADFGGAIYCWQEQVHIYENVIAFNTGGRAVMCDVSDDDNQLWHNVVFGNEDGDSLCSTHYSNLFVDPLVCDLYGGTGARRNLGLCANSPCLPEVNPWGVPVGAFGEACGDCASPVEVSSWGRLKALYR